jgi:hypothetical protein
MHMFPVLYSFATDQHCSVASQFSQGAWNLQLHPNLSQQASQELHTLQHLFLQDLAPISDGGDKRTPSVSKKNINTAYFYKLRHA